MKGPLELEGFHRAWVRYCILSVSHVDSLCGCITSTDKIQRDKEVVAMTARASMLSHTTWAVKLNGSGHLMSTCRSFDRAVHGSGESCPRNIRPREPWTSIRSRFGGLQESNRLNAIIPSIRYLIRSCDHRRVHRRPAESTS